MASDNTVNVSGNLVADPEIRYTNNGATICGMRVAVNRRWPKNGEWEEETSYFDITAWAQLAENCASSLTKGMRVNVSGRLEEQRWEDKETNEPRRKVVIIANEVSPSLRWATADVNKQQSGKSGGGSATQSSSSSYEPPF